MFWTLLAYCNHGEMCKHTFRNTDDLATFSHQAIVELTERFVTASQSEWAAARMAECHPTHWLNRELGAGRKAPGSASEEDGAAGHEFATAVAPVASGDCWHRQDPHGESKHY